MSGLRPGIRSFTTNQTASRSTPKQGTHLGTLCLKLQKGMTPGDVVYLFHFSCSLYPIIPAKGPAQFSPVAVTPVHKSTCRASLFLFASFPFQLFRSPLLNELMPPRVDASMRQDKDNQNNALIVIYFDSSLSPTPNPMGRRLSMAVGDVVKYFK